jgi:hypothetical protein
MDHTAQVGMADAHANRLEQREPLFEIEAAFFAEARRCSALPALFEVRCRMQRSGGMRIEACETFGIREQHATAGTLKNRRLAHLDGFVGCRKPLGCQQHADLATADRTAKRNPVGDRHAAKITQAARTIPSSVRHALGLYGEAVASSA